MKRPNRNLTINSSGIEKYAAELKKYVELNPDEIQARIDFYKLTLKLGGYAEFEEQYHSLRKNIKSSIVYREFARYLIFIKPDQERIERVCRKAIEVNSLEPSWVYYFAGLKHPYYEEVYPDLLYTAIPKNASTSLKTFILEGVLKEKDKNPHSVFGNPFFKNISYTKEKLNSSKKVLVTRNPADRFFSYFNKNILEEDSLAQEYGVDSNTCPELFGLKLKPTIGEFIENLWLYCLVFNDVLHHLLPQSAYIGELDEYDFVCDISMVDSLVHFVCDSFGFEKVVKAPQKMIPQNKNKLKQNSLLRQKVMNIYVVDYINLTRVEEGEGGRYDVSSFKFNFSAVNEL